MPVDAGSPHTIFTFGTVSDYAAPDTLVIWDSGHLSFIVPDEQLDLIIPTDLPGGVARIPPNFANTPTSTELTGLIVAAYFRQAGGDDAAEGPYYLLKLFGKPGFIEILSSQVEIVSGR